MIHSICRHVTDRNRLTAVSLTPEEVPDINGVAAGIGHSDLGYGTILVGRFVDHEEVPAAHHSWPNPRFPPYAERLRSLAGPAARNVMSRKTVMPARSSATLCSACLRSH